MNNLELVHSLKTLGLTVTQYEPDALIIAEDYSESDLERMLDQLRLPTCTIPRPIYIEAMVTSLLEKLRKTIPSPRPFLHTESDFQRMGITREEFCAHYNQYTEKLEESDTVICEVLGEGELKRMSEEMETVD